MALTLGQLPTAATTVFFNSISFPPLTPWSAVITTVASANQQGMEKIFYINYALAQQ